MDEDVKRKRPALVWVISIYIFLGAGLGLPVYILLLLGIIPLEAYAKAGFESLTAFGHGSALLIATSRLIGAFFLFRLQKAAFFWFATALAIDFLTPIWMIFLKAEPFEAMGTSGLVGSLVGFCISIAICMYSYDLIDREILK